MSPRVYPIDDLDAYAESLRRAEQEALRHATDEQRAITWGDYYLREYEGLVIFGSIPELGEVLDRERDLGASPEEIRETQRRLEASYERGYRFARAYSVVEPMGEWGSEHVANMTPIVQAQFETARTVSWDWRRVEQREAGAR